MSKIYMILILLAAGFLSFVAFGGMSGCEKAEAAERSTTHICRTDRSDLVEVFCIHGHEFVAYAGSGPVQHFEDSVQGQNAVECNCP